MEDRHGLLAKAAYVGATRSLQRAILLRCRADLAKQVSFVYEPRKLPRPDEVAPSPAGVDSDRPPGAGKRLSKAYAKPMTSPRVDYLDDGPPAPQNGWQCRAAKQTAPIVNSWEIAMGDEEKLRRAVLAHIERKTEEVWKSIDDLQKAMEAVPPAQRSGPEWGGEGELSKRFIELMKRLGDIHHQLQSGSAAIDEFRVSTKH